MEGLGYSYEDTLRGHDIAEWSNEEWDEWYAGEKGYWERVEAEPKRIGQAIRAVIHFSWAYPYCAAWNFRELFLLSLWWKIEKALGGDPSKRLMNKARRKRLSAESEKG